MRGVSVPKLRDGRGVLPSVSVRNWDDRKITHPVFAPMYRGSATPLEGGVSDSAEGGASIDLPWIE